MTTVNDKRINPAEIPALFKRLGMRPVRKDCGDAVHCGCLEVALAIDGGADIDLMRTGVFPPMKWFCDLEFGEDYSHGLRTGWDCGDTEASRFDQTDRSCAGIADGAEAARLVFGEAAP